MPVDETLFETTVNVLLDSGISYDDAVDMTMDAFTIQVQR